jgi:hypothetical protein
MIPSQAIPAVVEGHLPVHPGSNEDRIMKTVISVVLVSLVAGCSGVSFRREVEPDPAGHWQGYRLHDGMREPIRVSFDDEGAQWKGSFREGDDITSLSDVRVADSGRVVHFEVQGTNAYDGSVEGDSMLGTVTGPTAGSFTLSRAPEQDWNPYAFGP